MAVVTSAPALRRPGRFDQVVWMGLHDQEGRTALFAHHLREFKLDAGVDHAGLATEFAAATDGCRGADVAFICQRAVLLCVKAAGRSPGYVEIAIAAEHLREAVSLVTGASRNTLDTVTALRRHVTFYVAAHNSEIPHSAFREQTPDEMYYGLGAEVPVELEAARRKAVARRRERNRATSCAGCSGSANRSAAVAWTPVVAKQGSR